MKCARAPREESKLGVTDLGAWEALGSALPDERRYHRWCGELKPQGVSCGLQSPVGNVPVTTRRWRWFLTSYALEDGDDREVTWMGASSPELGSGGSTRWFCLEGTSRRCPRLISSGVRGRRNVGSSTQRWGGHGAAMERARRR